ncbi:short-chain fatty acyl-CoA regulator family protein [Streptomyces virginiae]
MGCRICERQDCAQRARPPAGSSPWTPTCAPTFRTR